MRFPNPATPRPATRALLTCLAACLLAPAAPAQGLPRARPADVGLSGAALERIAAALQSYVDSRRLPGPPAVDARPGKLAHGTAVRPMPAAQHRATRPHAV